MERSQLVTRPAFLETVPECWPGETIVCIGSGPSLLALDIEMAFNAGARLLTINDAVRLTGNQADVLFAADAKWWKWNESVRDQDLPQMLWTVDPDSRHYRPSVHVVNYNGHAGYERSRCSIRTGGHSGFMGVHLAAHLCGKGSKIILLGYDLQPTNGLNHFFGDHPDGNHLNYEVRRSVYDTLVEPFSRLGIRVFNATRATALTSFPCCSIRAALEA